MSEPSWIWIGFVAILLMGLVLYEYSEHDCPPHKECHHKAGLLSPHKTNSRDEIFNRLHEMLRSNVDFVIWRQALIGAIASSIFIIIFLYGRFIYPLELFFIGLFIFLGIYFSTSWMRAHFHSPNTVQIERGLFLLQDKMK